MPASAYTHSWCWHFSPLHLAPSFSYKKNSLYSRALHWSFFCQAVTSQTLPVARSHTHRAKHTGARLSPTPSSSFFPSHFLSFSILLSFNTSSFFLCLMYALNDSWAFYSAVDFHQQFFKFKLSFSLSCLTSSTAPCQLMTAWPPCRSTATSARSSFTNATSEWLAVCLPCCREIPTRHTFLLSVQVREPQILHGVCLEWDKSLGHFKRL